MGKEPQTPPAWAIAVGLSNLTLRSSGEPALEKWFAYGMLCNLGTAIGLPNIKQFSLRALAGGGDGNV